MVLINHGLSWTSLLYFCVLFISALCSITSQQEMCD